MRTRAAIRGGRPPGAVLARAAVPAAFAALALVVLGLGGAVGAAEPAATGAPRALIAFIPADPAPGTPLLEELARRPELAIGLTSPSVGGYSKRQAMLDASQGARIASRAYPDELERLDLVREARGGSIRGWQAARVRAADASGDVVPGLLATSIERAGGRVSYAGVVGLEQLEAVVAADSAGRVERLSLGTAGTVAERALRLWRDSDLLVVRLPEGPTGLAVLDRLIAARTDADLVYALRAPPRGLRMLATGVAGPGFEGTLRSETTRRDGLVATSDIAPTVLEHLDVPVPAEVDGQAIEAVPNGSVADVRELSARMNVIVPRREAALTWVFLAWLALLVALILARRRDGALAALRVAFLAALWLPALALVTAATAPTREVEIAVLALGGLGLGAVTDRLAPWPTGPVVPAAAVMLGHAIDLVAGSPLIARSLAGPNPLGGARFYGIGNELETILSVTVLFGTAAGLAGAGSASRRAPQVFAAVCVVSAILIGAGRLGAAVGGVITLGAGGAAAVLASLPGRLSGRRVAIAAGAPVAALAVLVAIDLATGGGAHLTRSVLDAGSPGELLDIAKRRSELSLAGLGRGTTPVSVAACVVLLVLGVARRRAVLAPLDRLPALQARAFRAGLAGALVATLVGALANDSGPVIFLIGSGSLILAAGYVNGRPRPAASGREAAGEHAGRTLEGASSTIPRCA